MEVLQSAEPWRITGETLGEMMLDLSYRFHNAIENIIPLKKKIVCNQNTRPWFTLDLLVHRRFVRNRERIYRKYKLNHQWEAYQAERKLYMKRVRAAKRSFISNMVLENKSDYKALYEIFNKLIGHKKSNPLPEHTDAKSLANKFAEYFYNKIFNIREGLKDLPKFQPKINQLSNCLYEFRKVSEETVRKTISLMKSKTCELDFMPTHLLKHFLDVMIEPLTRIINTSLSHGSFFDGWSTAIMTPLIKKSEAGTDLTNYRPVSNLAFISKVTESIAITQLQNHIMDKNLYPSHQSAYRKHHSCETALIRICNDILWSMEECKIFILIGTDLSGAFDTVDYDILLQTLEQTFGVTGTALNWFKNYLGNRHYKVKIHNSYSDEIKLDFSVPQGSRGGPDLYNLYAGSISQVVNPSTSIYAYADDHNFGKSFKPNVNDTSVELNCISTLESTVNSISKWMGENRLKLNPKKTEIMYFGSRQQLSKCVTTGLTIVSDYIEKSKFMRYLGTWLDQHMSFEHHVKIKCRTANWNLCRIGRIRKFLTLDARKSIIIATVISHLDYCNGVLFGITNKLLNKFQVIQNRAAKLILNAHPRSSSKEALIKLHWLPIRARIEFKILCIVFNCVVTKDAPQYLIDLLTLEVSRPGLRNKSIFTLKIPHVSKEHHAFRAFSVCGPRLWNSLSFDERNQSCLENFKKVIKTHLFKKYLVEDGDFIYY